MKFTATSWNCIQSMIEYGSYLRMGVGDGGYPWHTDHAVCCVWSVARMDLEVDLYGGDFETAIERLKSAFWVSG